jgi:hypothetical protein
MVLLIGLSGLLVLWAGCTVYRFPPPKPGMVVPGNNSRAKREIRVFLGKYSKVEQLMRLDSYGNEVLAATPLRLLWVGKQKGWIWEKRYLVFKSEEIVFPGEEDKFEFVQGFVIPYSYRLAKEMAGRVAILYLKPDTCYTLYGRDFRVGGEFLGDWVEPFCTSRHVEERRRTGLGLLWADKFIDLPKVDTSGPRRIQLKYVIGQ